MDDARELYQIRRWGGGFFDINELGHVVTRPHKTATPEIDLHEVIQGLKERGLKPPVIVAFSDLLNRRLKDLHLSAADFEDERGQVDGTTAHALERVIGLLAHEDGMRIVERSQLGVMPHQGEHLDG